MVQVFFILILSPLVAGAFSGDFTTNLTRQCRAFSRALKIEKLKAPLFRGPEGAGATNDWCIIRVTLFVFSLLNCKKMSENVYIPLLTVSEVCCNFLY